MFQGKVENQLFSFFGVPDVTEGYEPLQPITSTAPSPQATPPAGLIPNTAEAPAADSSETGAPDLAEMPAPGETQDRAEAQRTSDAETILASPREKHLAASRTQPSTPKPPNRPPSPG